MISMSSIGFNPPAPLPMGDNPISGVGYIDFDLENGVEHQEGRLSWNPIDGTLNAGLKGNNVNLQVGQEHVLLGKNVTGVQIDNGMAIHITGASANRPEFSFSDANDPSNFECIGIATEDIGTNQTGYVTTDGLVRDIDTSGTPVGETWGEGQRIYLSNTPGELTNVLPSGTERKVFIGIITRAHATEGIIWVLPINIFFLPELSGMGISNPQDNDVLAYDSATGLWKNQTAVEAGLVAV